MHAGNAVVIPRDEPHNIVADHLIFVAVDVVDTRHMQPDARKQRFPACDRVRADDGMVRREFVTGIQGRAPWGDELVAASLDGGAEDWLGAFGC